MLETGSQIFMHAEKWRNIKDILAEALMLDLAERHEFLDKAPITSETRREIESLLAVEENARDFMSVPASGFSQDFFAGASKPENSAAGQRIGVYEIVRELGLGGMGAVYLAERRDGKFEQQAAIKLLKREFNAGFLRRSFDREIAIQSKLVHPNIASIFDTGTTDDGIPYIVMEYVDGLPIDKFCRENGLDLKSRLKLFNKACEAVGFAHQNLIVHRDLKPSNIIVTADGMPKLLDFGISKLLDDSDGNSTGLTMIGAMTPEYASPEQVRGASVTTATDIYSLGVVLFKLLTNTFPFDLKNKFNGDILREITDGDPLSPSSAVRRMSGHGASALELKGDLDNIVLKALNKEPEKRYLTVQQLTEDIWRFIDGQPVHAHADTFGYRLSKFLRRRKIAVIAGTLVLLSLIFGLAISLWQANAARAQAQIASDARLAAEVETERVKVEQAKSEKISKFMAKVISYANPAWYAEGSRFGGNARVIDVLDDLSAKIDTEFEGQADIQAELHHKFAEVYGMVAKPWNTKDPAKADEFRKKGNFHALRALELRKQYYGDRHELVAKDLFYAHGLLETDRQKQAEILMTAIQMMRETNPQNLNLPYMLEAYSAGLILPQYAEDSEPFRNAVFPPTDENNFEIAERYIREALPIFRFHYKEDNSVIFAHECNLAYALVKQEKWMDFEEHYNLCKHGIEVMPTLASWLDLVDKALAEKAGDGKGIPNQ